MGNNLLNVKRDYYTPVGSNPISFRSNQIGNVIKSTRGNGVMQNNRYGGRQMLIQSGIDMQSLDGRSNNGGVRMSLNIENMRGAAEA